MRNRRGRGRAGGHPVLVDAAAVPGHRRGAEAGQRRRGLDQEAVAVLEVGELAAERGLRGAPPALLGLVVDADDAAGGVQAQVVAHGGAADARAQQQGRRLQRTARGHDLGCAHEHAGRDARRVGVGRLDAGGATALDHDAVGAAARHHLRAVLERVLEVGLQRALLGAGLVAEAEEAGGARVVGAAVGVAGDADEVVAECLAGLLHALVRAVEVRALVVDPEPPPHRVEVGVVVGSGHALEPELALPLLAHVVTGADAVRPVDRRAAAEVGPRHQRQRAVPRWHQPAAQEQVLVGPELELVEVALVVVAAHLEHDDVLALTRERPRDHAAAGARPDHAHVGVEHHLVRRGRTRRWAWARRAAPTPGPG